MISEDVFLRFLVVFGTHFCQLFVNIWCQEAIVDEKGEHVFLLIVVWFRRIFRVHKGQKTVNLYKKGRRSAYRFSDDVLGHIFVTFGPHFGALWGPNCTLKTNYKQRRIFEVSRDALGGGKGVREF